jgi:outer membrane protein assembly factor BamD (BamD/ComL family)
MAGRRRALIVSNSTYEDPTFRELVAPATDGKQLADVLADPEIGSFDSVQVLENQPHYVVKRTVAEMFRDLGLDDLAVLYFSCHGLKDQNGRLYLATVDTDHRFPEASAVEDQFIRDRMEQSRSRRQVLILDCCYSGAFAKGMVHRSDETVGTAERFQGRGQVVLAASDAMQYAFEGDQVIGQGVQSVFTSTLVEGLRTGTADLDQDGNTTVSELFNYVSDQVRVKMPRQTPIMSAIGAQGDLVIASNPSPIVKPAVLPVELAEAIQSSNSLARLGAVEELGRLLADPSPGVVLAAETALQQLSHDDSRRVASRASDMLSSRGQPVESLYAEARRLYDLKSWQHAIAVLEKVLELAPDHPYAADVLTSARQQLSGEQELEALYRQAEQSILAKDWTQAVALLEKVERRRAGYRNTRSLLTTARSAIAEQEERVRRERVKREQQERLATSFAEAQRAYDARNWERAIEKLREVVNLQPDYLNARHLLDDAIAKEAGLDQHQQQPEPTRFAGDLPNAAARSADPNASYGQIASLAGVLFTLALIVMFGALSPWYKHASFSPVDDYGFSPAKLTVLALGLLTAATIVVSTALEARRRELTWMILAAFTLILVIGLQQHQAEHGHTFYNPEDVGLGIQLVIVAAALAIPLLAVRIINDRRPTTTSLSVRGTALLLCGWLLVVLSITSWMFPYDGINLMPQQLLMIAAGVTVVAVQISNVVRGRSDMTANVVSAGALVVAVGNGVLAWLRIANYDSGAAGWPIKLAIATGLVGLVVSLSLFRSHRIQQPEELEAAPVQP